MTIIGWLIMIIFFGILIITMVKLSGWGAVIFALAFTTISILLALLIVEIMVFLGG